jgi:hypothetical protein
LGRCPTGDRRLPGCQCQPPGSFLVPCGVSCGFPIFPYAKVQFGITCVLLFVGGNDSVTASRLRWKRSGRIASQCTGLECLDIGVGAVLCYVVGARVLEDRNKRRLLWVVPAILAGFTSAASIVVAVSVLTAGRMELSPSRLSVVRTIVNCLLALALGFAGSCWKHVELRWAAYAAVVFGTLKLPLEDLRFGNAASLVISLLSYGSVLILLPRQTRRAPRKE